MAQDQTKDKGPLAARRGAVELIDAVLAQRKTLDEAMANVHSFNSLDGSDRSFAAYIARMILRRQGQIDALINHCLSSPLPKKASGVRDCLRVGIAQLFFSATADHAAVSTTVDLCRAFGFQAYAKLVNAVMRRLQREGETLIGSQDAARLNTPGWMFKSWTAAYGENTARAITEVHLATPPIDLTPKSDAAGWAGKLSGEVVLGGSIRLAQESEAVTSLEGFEEGAWWVQDAAARLPVAISGDLQGKTAFDLCAAPGGKTLALAAAGAKVTALDISEKRLRRVQENLTRTGLTAEIVTADVTKWDAPGKADVVLLDAPCSATGTIRRHPDALHLKSASDVEKLTIVQSALLEKAAEFVTPGGLLIYATCSLQPEEGAERVEAFLKDNPRFARVPITAGEIGGFGDAITPSGDLRTLPCHLAEIGGLDGFYTARLRLQS
jgi:16S rRNA (cytosine967-C5)-methyltransferase